MIAARDEHFYAHAGERTQKAVEQLYRLDGGHGSIVDVAGYDHRGGAALCRHLANFAEDVLLVFEHGKFVDPLAEVQVG